MHYCPRAKGRGQWCIEMCTAPRGSSFVYSAKQPWNNCFITQPMLKIPVVSPRNATLFGTRRQYTKLTSWRSTSFSCSPKSKYWFSIVPQNCLRSTVPLIFRPLFPWNKCLCSPVPPNHWQCTLLLKTSLFHFITQPAIQSNEIVYSYFMPV